MTKLQKVAIYGVFKQTKIYMFISIQISDYVIFRSPFYFKQILISRQVSNSLYNFEPVVIRHKRMAINSHE